jgi:hypothetical protein
VTLIEAMELRRGHEGNREGCFRISESEWKRIMRALNALFIAQKYMPEQIRVHNGWAPHPDGMEVRAAIAELMRPQP